MLSRGSLGLPQAGSKNANLVHDSLTLIWALIVNHLTNVARAFCSPRRTHWIVYMLDRERPFLLRVYLRHYPEAFDLEVIVTNFGSLRLHTRNSLREQRACRITCNLLTALS
jgi:hypothetical protein